MSKLQPLLQRNQAFARSGAHQGQMPQPNLGLFVSPVSTAESIRPISSAPSSVVIED